MIRRIAAFAAVVSLAVLVFSAPAGAVGPPCALTPKTKCYGVESLEASLSTTQAGAHPDLTYSFTLNQDPETALDKKGLYASYAPTRNVRFVAPPGLVGDPSVLGTPQLCSAVELSGGGCPNGSQIGIAEITPYGGFGTLLQPIYMMDPPGDEVVARVGFIIAGLIPVYADIQVRSESDYALVVEIKDATTEANLVRASATLWGVPADPSHDKERCTSAEAVFKNCKESPPRPPGSRPLPFLTNPTRCGVPLAFEVATASWAEPQHFDAKSAPFPQITGCNKLPYGPSLTIEPTNRRAGAPTGLDVTARVPASDGINVLEPAQTRDVRVVLPQGLSINTSAADGLETCSEDEVNFGERVAAECPDAAKLAGFEALIPALPRRLRGAVYLREPEPGNLFRVWVVADDLGVHAKLPGQLVIDESTGQIESTILDVPQVPLREMKLVFKSGLRAPLVNPSSCGTFASQYELTPWSGASPIAAESAMTVDEGCDEVGGFAPRLTAGTVDPTAGRHSALVFRLTREDGEQNPASLDVALPKGLSAGLAGIPRCEGLSAETGKCPAASQIGKVIAAAGAGPVPLWVPQPGKRPTAVYLGGPYKGAPLSVIAVVPAESGPFDLGDQVVRSAVFLDPVTAQGTVRSDALPQIIEGIPVLYRAVQVELNPNFALNPTSCAHKSTEATVTSVEGAVARPTSPFTAVNCAGLDFAPRLNLRLFGGTRRGSFPKLRARLVMPQGGANIAATSVAFPRSEFIEQGHFNNICTRVQFRADECPAGSVYGTARARSPLLDETLEGSVYLRSSDHQLPDVVIALKGPPSLPVEIDLVGHVDSVNGGVRTTFESVPDAPVSEFTLEMQGGKKGLFVNSENLCLKTNRATAKFAAQNGKQLTLHPAMQNSCKKKKGAGRHRRHR